MSRLSTDQYINGQLVNGFDYDLQVWVIDGVIQDCGHPDSMRCASYCNQRKYHGMKLSEVRP